MSDSRAEAQPSTVAIFESNPRLGEVIKAAHATPPPFAEQERESGIAAVLAGIFAGMELAANRTMAATDELAEAAIVGPRGLLTVYQRYDALRGDVYAYGLTPSAADEQPETHTVQAPVTITDALEYLVHSLNGVGDALPATISPEAVRAARAIRAMPELTPGTPEFRPEALAILWDKVLAGASRDMVATERDQLIQTISGEHRGLYRLADIMRQHFEETHTLHPDHIRQLLSHFGLNEHVETVLGHLGGTLGRELQHLPVVGDFVKRVMGLVTKLSDKQGTIRNYITAQVDSISLGLAGLDASKLSMATIQTATDALDVIAAFGTPGVIPAAEDLDRAELARALLAITVLENPSSVFAASGPLGRQIAERLKIIALFDIAEEGNDSLLKTAQRLAKEAEARSLGTTAVSPTTQPVEVAEHHEA